MSGRRRRPALAQEAVGGGRGTALRRHAVAAADPDGDVGSSRSDAAPGEGATTARPSRRSDPRRARVLRIAATVAAAVALAVALVGAVDANGDARRARTAAHRRTHRAATEMEAMRDARLRTATLDSETAAARAEEARDATAASDTIVALDRLETLRDRLALAEHDLARGTQASADQQARLATMRDCIAALEEARVRLVAGEGSAAALLLASGQGECRDADALLGESSAHPFDFPDPQVMVVDDTAYAFGTNGPAGTIQVLVSNDLGSWELRGSALTAVPGWARPGFTWAPAAVRTFDGYLLFYTARDRISGHQCISRATSPNPEGPYTDTSIAPLICQHDEGGSIDPSPYRDDTGRLHLTWKSEGETVGRRARIWTVPLVHDGSRLAWIPIPLLRTDQPWEGRTIEAPSMTKAAGRWVLLYSGNRWDTADYSVGYALCDGPRGPCTKPADNVVLRTDDRRAGPGGAEAFRTADGRLKVAYAAWDTVHIGRPNPRRLHLATVSMTPLGLRVT